MICKSFRVSLTSIVDLRYVMILLNLSTRTSFSAPKNLKRPASPNTTSAMESKGTVAKKSIVN